MRDDVLEQPALVGVVVLDAGRGGGELADELVVDQEALDQGAEVRVAHRQQHLAEPGRQLGDVLRALGQEVLGLDAVGSRTSMCERMIWSEPWKTWVLPRTCR